MSTQYSALVEADAILVIDVPDDEDPEEFIEERTNTGHLGPAVVRGIEKDE